MQNLTVGEITSTIAHYQTEAEIIKLAHLSNPTVLLLALTRINADVPLLLHYLNHHESNPEYKTTYLLLQSLHASVTELMCLKKRQAEEFQKQYESTTTDEPLSVEMLSSEPRQTDDYASLRQRLLSDGTSTMLDKRPANSEKANQYHENFQEELYSDLTDLASALKSSAQSLSSKITADSKLVSSTSEKMEKNLTLMQSVGKNLNGYLNEKTGGKISLWFLIKTMVGIFALTILMLILIKVLPKM